MIFYFFLKEIMEGEGGGVDFEINCIFIIYFCYVLGWYFIIY